MGDENGYVAEQPDAVRCRFCTDALPVHGGTILLDHHRLQRAGVGRIERGQRLRIAVAQRDRPVYPGRIALLPPDRHEARIVVEPVTLFVAPADKARMSTCVAGNSAGLTANADAH